MYELTALSTRSSTLRVLVLGRILGGTATSLLFSAPEAWLVGEHSRLSLSGAELGEIFGWAYFGDGIAAILAGQIAGYVSARKGTVFSGVTAPFEVSILFLVAGAAMIAATFSENFGGSSLSAASSNTGVLTSLKLAVREMLADRRILLTGLVQSLFEGAMYIFVLQWPPALTALARGRPVPFGKVFSCLMTACMIGSSLFGVLLSTKVTVEASMACMLALACAALTLSAHVLHAESSVYRQGDGALHALVAAFLVFETAVGLYFPSIGTLRSKYVPDAHKGTMVNLFRIPLNLIVISTFLSMQRLGVSGALSLASACLAMACVAQCALLLHPPPPQPSPKHVCDTNQTEQCSKCPEGVFDASEA